MRENEIVWKHRAVRHMAGRLCKNGVAETCAIEIAHHECETVWPDHGEYATPEAAADAAYESLADAV